MLNNSTLRDKYPSYDGQVNGVFAVKSGLYFYSSELPLALAAVTKLRGRIGITVEMACL